MSIVQRYLPKTVRDRDDVGTNPTDSPPFFEIAEARVSRRGLMKQLASGAALGLMAGTMTSRFALAADDPSSLTFEEVARGVTDTHQVAKGYSADVLIRWGDPVVAGEPAPRSCDGRWRAPPARRFHSTHGGSVPDRCDTRRAASIPRWMAECSSRRSSFVNDPAWRAPVG